MLRNSWRYLFSLALTNPISLLTRLIEWDAEHVTSLWQQKIKKLSSLVESVCMYSIRTQELSENRSSGIYLWSGCNSYIVWTTVKSLLNHLKDFKWNELYFRSINKTWNLQKLHSMHSIVETNSLYKAFQALHICSFPGFYTIFWQNVFQFVILTYLFNYLPH